MCTCKQKCSCDRYCKTTLLAKCVKNFNELLLLKGTNNTVLQTLLININNALKSISTSDCISYTRTIDPDTNIATYEHTMNWECMSQYICDTCNTPCSCAPPSNLNVSLNGEGLGSPYLYRVILTWVASSDASNYTIEYKKSSEALWNTWATSHSGTSIDTLILDISDEDYDYDFRVRANCEGCNSSYITLSTTLVPCNPPYNVTWNQDGLYLIWNSEAGLTPSTSFEIKYRQYSSPTWITASVPISEVSPGLYRANFASIMLVPNRIYLYSVVRKCNGKLSDVGEGCAKYCSVSLQSDPSVDINPDLTATLTWVGVPSIFGYKISIYNVTDSVFVIEDLPLTSFFTSYTTGVLETDKTYEFTVLPICSLVNDDCEGRSVIEEIPEVPDFRLYSATTYECDECRCKESGETIVAVDYPLTLTIGGFYTDTIPSDTLYEIIEEVVYEEHTAMINIDSYQESCLDFCPILYKYYNANKYICIDGECVEDGTELVRVLYEDSLVIGKFYHDVGEENIYEILSLAECAEVGIDINIETESDSCDIMCPVYYYDADVYNCLEQCTTNVSTVVRSYTPLSIGSHYVSVTSPTINYLITGATLTTSVINVINSPYINCSTACIGG